MGEGGLFLLDTGIKIESSVQNLLGGGRRSRDQGDLRTAKNQQSRLQFNLWPLKIKRTIKRSSDQAHLADQEIWSRSWTLHRRHVTYVTLVPMQSPFGKLERARLHWVGFRPNTYTWERTLSRNLTTSWLTGWDCGCLVSISLHNVS